MGFFWLFFVYLFDIARVREAPTPPHRPQIFARSMPRKPEPAQGAQSLYSSMLPGNATMPGPLQTGHGFLSALPVPAQGEQRMVKKSCFEMGVSPRCVVSDIVLIDHCTGKP
jgi:hypothetical protein